MGLVGEAAVVSDLGEGGLVLKKAIFEQDCNVAGLSRLRGV